MDNQKIKRLKDQVEHILQTEPESRNSDKTLTISIWVRFYAPYIYQNREVQYIALDSLYALPSQDNIKRVRAKFNAAGLYLPTVEKVMRQRGINETVWHEYMAKNNYRQAEIPF